jgi:hypothetical protein
LPRCPFGRSGRPPSARAAAALRGFSSDGWIVRIAGAPGSGAPPIRSGSNVPTASSTGASSAGSLTTCERKLSTLRKPTSRAEGETYAQYSPPPTPPSTHARRLLVRGTGASASPRRVKPIGVVRQTAGVHGRSHDRSRASRRSRTSYAFAAVSLARWTTGPRGCRSR